MGSGTIVKGLGTTTSFYTPQGEVLRLTDNGATSVNYANILTGSVVGLYAQGASTNVALSFVSKGTGGSTFATGGTSATQQFAVSHTASAVNYVQVTGSVTSPSASTIPTISVQGSDASTYLGIGLKGTGGYVSFYNNGSPSATTTLFRVRNATGTLANYFSVYPSIAGAAPFIASEGSDTNIDLTLTPKGTGVIQFGTYTASVLTPTGYITIKDSGGTTRRLLVG